MILKIYNYFLFVLINFFVSSQCANILGIFWFPSYSHQTVFQPIFRELSLRGHNVTVFTPNPINDSSLTGLTEIDISYVYKFKISGNTSDQASRSFWEKICRRVYNIVTAVLEDERMQNICNRGEKEFDLVLIEALSPTFYGIGEKCGAPTIGITSLDALLSTHSAIGNPIHPYLYGDSILQIHGPLSISQKMYNTFYFVFYKWFYKSTFLPQAEELKRKYIGKNLPHVKELEKNISMLFINTNALINTLRPLIAASIQLGFLHIKKELDPLPKDLQTILDNASQGAVYFSLGSNVRSSELPPPTVKLIKEALSEIPYTVLWKWETDNVPDVGPNVITRKWFPQQDILAHKNLKGFVTQGGLQSTEEAINYGVPMVGIPFLGDQEMNVKQSMKQGISLYLDHRTMSKDDLKKSIIEIMENPKYFTRIQELKEIAQDQPMTGLERAVWWSEYVIRHKGAKHLRSPVVDMPMWEYLMLDVIAVVLSAFIIISYILYKLIKILFRVAFSRFRKVKKE